MSPAVRVGNPRAPGPGAAVVAEDEEAAAAAVAWRELRGKAAELAAAAEERAILARRIEAALQVRPCRARKWLEPIAPASATTWFDLFIIVHVVWRSGR